jgi:hypothetical protein
MIEKLKRTFPGIDEEGLRAFQYISSAVKIEDE